MRRQALGRGLSALFGDGPRQPVSQEVEDATGQAAMAGSLRELGLDKVRPARQQPRTDFDQAALEELAASISENGVIQPIVVRPLGADDYEIIAGERRWRAARQLGLETIPVVVREVAAREALELALVENLQREDLNPIEEARAYELLLREHELTQEEIAKRVGKDRSSVSNTLRLLRLPEPVQDMLREQRLSAGHARALLGLSDKGRMQKLADQLVEQGLSVRQTEELVRHAAGLTQASRPAVRKPEHEEQNVHDRAAEKKLTQRLATRVEIQRKGKGGRINIRFHGEEELMRVYDLLMGRGEA